MQHLSASEILGFLSMKKADARSVEISAEVNSHIRHCAQCLERVKAFQRAYDAFSAVGIEFEEYMPEADIIRNRNPENPSYAD